MRASRVSGRIIAAALVVIGFVASCAQLMGGVDVEGPPIRPNCEGTDPAICRLLPGPDAGVPSRPHICELGTTQCDGRLLQLCTDEGTAWATLQQCASNALCEGSGLSTVSACIPPKCADEQMSCDGNILRLCNADRSGWEKFDTCKTAAHCDAGNRQCLPAPCNPGDRRCNVGNLEKCRDDQTDWEQLDTCATNELCEATLAGTAPGVVDGNVMGTTPAAGATPPAGTSSGASSSAASSSATSAMGAAGASAQGPTECRAPVCLPKEVRCTGFRLEACNEGQTAFELAEECATPVLCDASITYTGLRGSPRCVRPTCAADEHDCTAEGVLEVCTDDRDGYRTVEECIGPPFCNSVAADNGGSGCEDAPCEAGEKQCNGPQIQVCTADRTGFDAVPDGLCETRDLCNDSDPNNVHCDPPVCRRGALSGTEFRCEGATLERCNEQETGYDTLNTCATAGLCNAGLGFNGCQAPVCGPGQTRCNGDFLQTCNANRNGFDNQEKCAAGTCDSTAGRCADPCIVGSARCNTQGQLEECRDRLIGREITARCLSPQLCDSNARTCRQPPAGCTADGVRQCVRQGAATVLQQCTNGRSAFATVDTCTGAEVCDPNNAACDVCDQNSQATCQGNTLVTCAADGQTQSAVNCPNGCEVVPNGPDRCRSCVLAAATCEGSQLAVCVARGATDEFIERRACDSAALCQQALTSCASGRGGQDCRCQPGVCAPGDRDCSGAQPTACNADRTAMVASGPACSSALNCNPKPVGACFPCAPGDVRCGSDGIMEGCLSDRSGFANLPGATAGQVRCISSNGGVASQSCNGATLVQQTCTSGICNADGSGCAECDPSNFASTCATDGSVARTECIAGSIEERACDPAGGSCSQAVCDRGACNTASKARGTACTRSNGSAGFCDGLQSTPSCVECIADAACNDGNPCTADSCGITGACVHTPTTGAATGCAGVCSAGSCCGDGAVSGSEQCDGQAPQSCGAGQVGSITCVNCQLVNTCARACDPAQCGSVGCNAATNACNTCNAATSCGGLQLGPCQRATCGGANGLTCVAQDTCQAGQICDPGTNQCVAPCDPAQCGSVGCNAAGTACNACNAATSCGGLQLGPCQRAACGGANGLTCVAQNTCQSGQLCDPGTNQCVAACDPAQCGSVGCNAATNACNTCNAATSCAGLQLGACQRAACGGANGLTCVAQNICQAGQLCDSGTNQCVAACDPTQCTFGCNPAGSACNACVASQCGSVGCNAAGNACNTCAVGVNCNAGPCQTATCGGANGLTCQVQGGCQPNEVCDAQTNQCTVPAVTPPSDPGGPPIDTPPVPDPSIPAGG